MQTLKIKIQDNQYKPLVKFLKTLDYIEIESEKLPKAKETTSIEKGTYKADEKPSQYAGLWKNEKRDLKAIRQEAWKLKK
jgi:hypothetical protein